MRDTVRDPVCGMIFVRNDAAASAEWKGRTYYFCCGACKEAFLSDPERFLDRSGEGEAA